VVAILLLHEGGQAGLYSGLSSCDEARGAQTIDLCVSAPASVAPALINSGFAKPRPEYVLQALRDTPFDRWRDNDAEDTLRLHALRMRDRGFVKSTPQKIVSGNTDWRSFNELKRELNA
jgi:hypothetical protein